MLKINVHLILRLAIGSVTAITFALAPQLAHAQAPGALVPKWTIADRCDGTLVRDITDSVAVTDFVRHKTIILHVRQRYFAPRPRKKP